LGPAKFCPQSSRLAGAARHYGEKVTATSSITIPSDLLPADGRFGSGPSRVRPEAVAALAAEADTFLGTSHRKPRVKDIVGRMRSGLHAMFGLPDDWEILVGNGGATTFWDYATFGLIEDRSQHLVFGEFSSKFAKAVQSAPHLSGADIISSDFGSVPVSVADAAVDVYALTHNETSTGVMAPIVRPDADGLVVVDATSGAGGLEWDTNQADVYYFSPQKCLAAEGGIWIAACSPAALDRIRSLAASDRWCPASLDLAVALDNSVLNQTYNTPALSTIYLTMHMTEWINDNGGLAWSAARCAQSASNLYGWTERVSYATPFVTDPTLRSNTVGTIDFDDSVSADEIAAVLRQNGIVDTEGYRKLGRNQLRIAMFPAIDPHEIVALTQCIDHVVEALTA
jgi:phosphoserine aminotransferase